MPEAYHNPMPSATATSIPAQSNGLWRALAFVIILLALLARTIPGPRTIDDSYITYRYARNLLEGVGFVYNPGERVLGTTTPLYTALMVAGAGCLRPLGFDPSEVFPVLSLVINALADTLTCLLLLRLGRRLGAPYAGVGAALLWAIAPFSVTFAIGGLETSVYVLLLTATAYAHLTDRHILTAGLAALAFLTRPDALILIGPLGLDRAWQIWRTVRQPRSASTPPFTLSRLVLEALVFLGPTLAWLTFAWLYFGSPLPHSIAAKSLAYRLEPEAGFVRLLQHYTTPFLEHLTFTTAWIAIGMVLYPFLFLVGARRSLGQAARLWPFVLYPMFYFAVFAIANPLIFRWYMTPPLPPYILTILIGTETVLVGLATGLTTRRKQKINLNELAKGPSTTSQALPAISLSRWATTTIIALVVLAPTLLSLREWRVRPDHGLHTPAPDMAWYKLELLYRQAADLLAPEIAAAPTQRTLAAGDVGVLGFFARARILDLVGLNSPVATTYFPLDPQLYVISYAVPPDLVIDQLPDYVVILEVYGRLGLLKDERFLQAYYLRQKIPTDIYGSDGLLIFERNEH